ncbi:MAG: hypothetical protein KUG81_07570 [Gammaproteobacteria bacterium]|nr:hypothetical protein [Gammaproteobacteria bacterium]
MAEITMDSSEWDLMRENAKLLKDSLAREKELSDKLDVANKEKIDALKSNEKNVTVITKTSVITTNPKRVSDADINRHLVNKMSHVLERIVHEFMHSPDPFRIDRGSSRFMNDMHHFDGMSHTHRLSDILRNKEGLLESVMREINFSPESLHNMFFKDSKTKTTYLEDEVITKGLDEVKVQLGEDLLKTLSAKAQKALEINPELTREVRDAVDEMKAADKNAKKANKRLALAESLHLKKDEEIVDLKDQLVKIKEITINNREKIYDVALVVSDEITTFGNKKRLKEVKQIINKK